MHLKTILLITTLLLTTNASATALTKAITKSVHLDTIKALLKDGESPDGKTSDGFTPLYFSALYKRIDIISLLIEYGADINLVGTESGAALHVATYKNHIKVMQKLLKAGANPCIKNTHEATSLELAKSKVAKKLLLQHMSGKNCKTRTLYIFNGNWQNKKATVYIEWVGYQGDIEGYANSLNGDLLFNFSGKNHKYNHLSLTLKNGEKVTLKATQNNSVKTWSSLNRSIVFSRKL